MLLKNAKLYGKDGNYTIKINDGMIEEIIDEEKINEEIIGTSHDIELDGKLVLPPFVESHIHLDYAFSAGNPYWNESGTLFEGIQIWSKRKLLVKNEKKEYKKRALKALERLIMQGVQHVRTHVDITDPSLVGLEAIMGLKEELSHLIDIQIVAFPQEGMYSYENGVELLEEALRYGADVVGGIPHYEDTYDDGIKSIKKSIDLAQKYNKLVDIHCDEVDDPQSRFIEVLAAEAYKSGMGSEITASHTTAMGSYNSSYSEKLFKLISKTNLNFISLPKANLHLQGRGDQYPKRRGLTRVKELLDIGMNVSFGVDSIQDPWYPLGDGNLLDVVEFGLHATHMTGYKDIMTALNFITINGAKTLNIEKGYQLQKGNQANLIVLDTNSDYDAIRCQPTVLYSIRNGEIIVQTESAKSVLNLPLFI